MLNKTTSAAAFSSLGRLLKHVGEINQIRSGIGTEGGERGSGTSRSNAYPSLWVPERPSTTRPRPIALAKISSLLGNCSRRSRVHRRGCENGPRLRWGTSGPVRKNDIERDRRDLQP